MATNSPIPPTRLQELCNSACDSALSTTSYYNHALTQEWNNTIINSILKSIISESSAADTKYKFAVNSTIIQHLSDPRSSGAEAGTQTDADEEAGVTGGQSQERKVGRRGMHSASGAYWNNERDGMWSHKYEGGEGKGMDIVVSIMWIGV
ncbi:uncharacterized protein LTR77_004484 [Saxophila tyrrhenica]|uniref:Dynein light chain n=1 Tax=Saxophila tyrrhenica TaxID=1690608 RepID=A0AAV9PG31_9PEZI|nr:hypothetical protein LTR77_004484 [Saxophila tyrrhenica]